MSSFGRSQNASTIQLPEIELQTCRGTSSWEAKVMALGPRLLGGTFQSQPPWIASTLNNLIYHPFVSWKFPKFHEFSIFQEPNLESVGQKMRLASTLFPTAVPWGCWRFDHPCAVSKDLLGIPKEASSATQVNREISGD